MNMHCWSIFSTKKNNTKEKFKVNHFRYVNYLCVYIGIYFIGERKNKQTTLEPHKIFKLKITIGKEIQHSTQPHK